MRVDLTNASVVLHGEGNYLSGEILVALNSNGAKVESGDSPPDLLIVVFPLLPDTSLEAFAALSAAQLAAEGMVKRGKGRVIFVLSAVGAVPMRRHARYSAQMAAVASMVRSLAMQAAPRVLVNGVGVGVIGGVPIAGDLAMLTHTAAGRPGAVADVTNAVLFLADPMNTYTTGQLLLVDGGWSAGYGRNF